MPYKKFAGEGLRTLALAWRPLEERGFAEWKRRHQAAALALRDRDERLDAIYEEIETDLILMGEFVVLLNYYIKMKEEYQQRDNVNVWLIGVNDCITLLMHRYLKSSDFIQNTGGVYVFFIFDIL